jgi:hypothetical protein
MDDLLLSQEKDPRIMRLLRLWDDENLLIRNKAWVNTPGRDKVFPVIIFINTGDVRSSQLDLCARGTQKHLSCRHALCVSRDTLDSDEDPERE